MSLEQFIADNKVEYTENRVDESFLEIMQNELHTSPGQQMRQYILRYGYLAYQHIELYGINTRQGINSDMIRSTKLLYQTYELTRGFIALEDAGDGDFFVVDSEDNVYEFLPEVSREPKPVGKKLFDYILARFSGL
jgi:hypothetical protein